MRVNLNTRARNWCFTVGFSEFCPGYELYPDVWFNQVGDCVTYACWQFEVGEGGHEHLQGYLECMGKVSLKKLLSLDGFDTQIQGYSIRLFPRGGTQAEAIAYCRKVDETTVAGTFVEWGTKKAQGSRADLDDIKELIDQGASMKRVADVNFGCYIRYHRGFKEYKRISTVPRTVRTMIVILIGCSGVGKSRLARDMFPDAYWKNSGQWWCDYSNEECVIWDEFKGQYPFTSLLRILDSSPLTVESKGSSCCFNSKIVVFTSNHHPSEWYDPEKIHVTWEKSPLNRRIREYGQIMNMDRRCPPSVSLGLMPIAFGARAGFQPLLGNAPSYRPASPENFGFFGN